MLGHMKNVVYATSVVSEEELRYRIMGACGAHL
jgi:hypothetical protein